MESEALGHNEISITYGGGRAHLSSESPPYLKEKNCKFNLNYNKSEERGGFDKLRYI